MQRLDPRERLHLEDIDRHHASPALVGPDALRRDLTPAAGRGAEIDHARARLEQAKLVGDLDQLVGGARTQAFALGARHVRVVELALEPKLRGERAALSGPQPYLEFAAAPAAARGAHRGSPQAPAARITSPSIPPRGPRSAARSRSQGKARRIASRRAQPASTRSARSEPMQGLERAARSPRSFGSSASSTT